MKESKEKTKKENTQKAFDTTDLAEFNKYLKSPWRIMWNNFLSGVFKGFGIIIGMTVVFGVAVWLVTALASSSFLNQFDQLKQYVNELESLLSEYAESTNYKEEFQQIHTELETLNQTLTTPTGLNPANFPPEIVEDSFPLNN